MVARATPLFKELGLDNAGAQKLTDLYSQAMTDAVKAVDDMRASWRDEVSKDPDMGSKLESVKVDIGRMKDAVFANNPGLRREFDDAMNLTGAGDHRAIVKAMWIMSEAFKEGTHVSGSAPSKHGQAPGPVAPPTAAQAMYPNLPSSQARH